MEMLDLKKKNMLCIFDSIVRGNKTLSDISKDTGISKMTTCELTQLLIKNKIIVKYNEPENKVGRRSNIYTLDEKRHCMYIEERKRGFSCISIDVNGRVVQRLEYAINGDITMDENIITLFQFLRKKRAFSRFCLGVFVICKEENKKYFPDKVIHVTKEELILNGLSDPSKILLFKFKNQLIISAYDHIHYPNKFITAHQIRKTIKIDKTYSCEKQLYFIIYNALQSYIIKFLRELIKQIK